MILLALILWTWIPDADALQVYSCAFAKVYDVDCDEALAVAWIESRHQRNPTSSHRPEPWSPDSPWRICGVYQTTGGRYGKPDCALQVTWLWVGVWAGVSHIAYWQGRCRATWACAYHQGNSGCEVEGCHYQRRMKRLARRRPWEKTTPRLRVFRDLIGRLRAEGDAR